MINILKFRQFLTKVFSSEIMSIDEFKTDLQFVEIDCFKSQPNKLVIEISCEKIKMSSISKEPSIDFSLYDYVFDNINDAENLILKIKETEAFPSKD